MNPREQGLRGNRTGAGDNSSLPRGVDPIDQLSHLIGALGRSLERETQAERKLLVMNGNPIGPHLSDARARDFRRPLEGDRDQAIGRLCEALRELPGAQQDELTHVMPALRHLLRLLGADDEKSGSVARFPTQFGKISEAFWSNNAVFIAED